MSSGNGARLEPRAEIQVALRKLAGAWGNRRSVKAAVSYLSRVTGFPPSRVKDLLYGQARRIDASEMDAVRALLAKKNARERDDAATENLQEEIAALKAGFARLEAQVRAMQRSH